MRPHAPCPPAARPRRRAPLPAAPLPLSPLLTLLLLAPGALPLGACARPALAPQGLAAPRGPSLAAAAGRAGAPAAAPLAAAAPAASPAATSASTSTSPAPAPAPEAGAQGPRPPAKPDAAPRREAAPEQAAAPPSPPLPSATRPASCAGAGPRVGAVGRTPPELRELSGLVASRRHPGVFWAHNDSDHALALYAVDAEGRVLARFPLLGARALDVEDVAVTPCEAGTCILLADVGDNGRKRAGVQLLRLPEPATLEGRALRVEALPFTYADGAHDAESLLVEPEGGAPWVLTKPLDALGRLYRVEGLGPGRVGRAVKVATLPAQGLLDRAATSAALSPDGRRLLVRSYTGVWEWAGTGGERGVEALAALPARRAPSGAQPQGEALAFLPDGSGYLLGSERAGAPLLRVDCLPSPAAPVRASP